MSRKRDRALGMGCPIHRRDFLNGAAMSAATVSTMTLADPSLAAPSAQDKPGYYPPTLNGIRGSQPGSFDVAHSVRDGTFWQTAEKMSDTDSVYDLVIVGAGISGLAAAAVAFPWFFWTSVIYHHTSRLLTYPIGYAIEDPTNPGPGIRAAWQAFLHRSPLTILTARWELFS